MHIAYRPVVDRDSAADFIIACVNGIGAGYHPDTLFADYVDSEGGPLFQEKDAAELDSATDAAFSFLGDELYDVAARSQRKVL